MLWVFKDGGNEMVKRSFFVPGWALGALLVIGLVGCAEVKVDITPSAELNAQARMAPPAEYLIQPGDQLDVNFPNKPEYNLKVLVRPDGRISLLKVKEVVAAGVPPRKLEEILNEKYSATPSPGLKDPDIAVMVSSFSAQKIFVDGQVNHAGLVPLTGPCTVLQAIAQAGGMAEGARKTQVLVIRQNPKGPFFTAVVDLTKAIDGKDKSQDIALMPYDIVYVPKSAIASVDTWVDQYVRRMLPFALPSPLPQPTSTGTWY